MRFFTIIIILFLLAPLFSFTLTADTVEGIYAIVNDEIITFSEIENFEKGMIMDLKSRFSGEELTEQINKMKAELLDLVIGRKVLLSKAREKNYDMNQYLEMVIKEIMKRNKLETRDDLLKALNSQGISYEEFKKQRLEQLMQEKFIQESLGSRVSVDTSEIIAYYKENAKKYTIPAKFKLNCIFLNKDHYFTEQSLQNKKKEISKKLSDSGDFLKTAEEYSELEGAENNYELGTFSRGELNSSLETEASKLAVSAHSDWIDTENGIYIIQLTDKTEARLKEYKKVKRHIENSIYEKKRQSEITVLVDELKKESYIKILKEYK